MSERMNNMGARHWDPLFQALYAYHKDIEFDCNSLEDGREGVRCVETLTNDAMGNKCALDLIEAHAWFVNEMVDKDQIRKAMSAKHAVPDACPSN
jgi:hypothetical protein